MEHGATMAVTSSSFNICIAMECWCGNFLPHIRIPGWVLYTVLEIQYEDNGAENNKVEKNHAVGREAPPDVRMTRTRTPHA